MKTKYITPILIALIACPGFTVAAVAEVQDPDSDLSAYELEGFEESYPDSLADSDIETERSEDLASTDVPGVPPVSDPLADVQDENIEAEIRAESARQELAELERLLSEDEVGGQG